MRIVTALAVVKSKSARRKVERLEYFKNYRVVDPVLPPTSSTTLTSDKASIIKPFDDIEEW